jgi:flavin reductase (DIM6/NTAB) family NADH-FMN oxidoreductase RutF/DNA-binding IclR family transcriptional regulator
VAITAMGTDGSPAGMTVGSFTSVSLDPPLVAFLPARSSTTFPAIKAAGHFCVNVLSHRQEPVCRAFATPGVDRFAGLRWEPAPSGAPVLAGSLAWIDCDIESVTEAGDHYIVIGRVTSLGHNPQTSPLLFFQGGYGRFSSPSLTAPAEGDLMSQLRFMDSARAEMEALADRSGHSCIALALVDDEVAVVGSASPEKGTGLARRVGQRWPCTPPFGTVFLAWASQEDQCRWLERARLAASESELAAFRDMLATVRERGWSLAFESQSQLDLLDAIEQTPLVSRTREQLQTLSDAVRRIGTAWHEPAAISPGTGYKVRTLGAPVRDRTGRVVLEIVLFPIEETCTRQDIYQLAASVTEAAERVTGCLAS